MADQAGSIDQHYSQAFEHHGAGRLDEAASLYRAILAIQPDHADTLHLLGVLTAQTGDPARAATLIERAISLNPEIALYHANLAEVLTRLGRPDRAIEAGRAALARQPALTGTWVTMGMAFEALGPIEDALACYTEALRLQPDYAQAHTNLAALLGRLGRLQEAEPHFREVIRLEPASWSAYANLAGLLLQQACATDAEPFAREALRLNPQAIEARLHMGTLDAMLDRLEEAEEQFRAALVLNPDHVDALHNLSIVLERQFRFDEAEAILRRALEIRPGDMKVSRALAILAGDTGRYGLAEQLFRQRIEAVPDDADAHLSLAFNLLLTGRLAEGWQEYGWRWKSADGALQHRPFPQAQWQGKPIDGKILLLHAEQGLGDTIHFCRYVKLIDAGARILLEVPEQLLRLAGTIEGVGEVILAGQPLPPFDLHCPLLSLPGLFGTTLETIPAEVPYLSADPALVARWRERLAPLPPVRVGLAWSGGARMVRDRQRSIALESLRDLATIPGIALVSLQKGDAATQTAISDFMVHDWTSELADMADTAALIEALDLVISVDTAPVHLAGALGKPVWLLNRFSPDWRWLQDRDDSPWYPSLRQFRQPAPGDWGSVMAALPSALAEFAQKHGDST